MADSAANLEQLVKVNFKGVGSFGARSCIFCDAARLAPHNQPMRGDVPSLSVMGGDLP